MRSVIAINLLLFIPSLAESHQDRLNTHDCHHNRKVGIYKCHKGEFSGRAFATKAEMFSKSVDQAEKSERCKSRFEIMSGIGQ